ILSNQNYLCVKAGSGNEALKILLHQQDFAIILMDVQMPMMDGFETAELIRETEKLKHVPIIFLTASMDSPVHIFKGYQAGAVDYMIKPFSPEILKAKVAVFVELHKKNQELVVQAEQMKSLNSNITERIRFEKELIEAKGKAESATRIAEDAVKAKQQFLSNMSHEIRTPMNAIIGFTKVMLKTDLSAKQKEYLTAIKMSGDTLIVLINDILDLAKVDAGKMTFEQTPFKMALSISAMLHLFEIKIQEKNLELVKEYDNNIPEVLIGDPVRLHQIILNLLSNAVKFTAKGKITISVRLLNEDEERATIEFAVTDTGIGIPENRIGNIFENFQQATSGTARLFGGTGLGLAIVKQLVEPQGGSISVKSKLEEGSTFSFQLSFQKTNDEAKLETDIVELDKKIKNIKVLVVEDIALNQLLMKTLLDDFGFEFDIAANGEIAIKKLQTKSYDIILMDLQMPVMNGFEATEYIRNTMNSKIPIIALTADVTTVDLAKCKAVGMNDYI
ncbi:MAG TPA: response regulator, partial [Chitinophagaceae bacterium]